jgi:hypothetical protein
MLIVSDAIVKRPPFQFAIASFQKVEVMGAKKTASIAAYFTNVSQNIAPAVKSAPTEPFNRKKASRNLMFFWCVHNESNRDSFKACPKRGFGLRTLVDAKKGQLVCEYRGEVITAETAAQRMETVYRDNRCFYFLDYSNGEILDGTLKGTEARFVVC